MGLEMKCLMSNPCEFHYTVSPSQFDMCLLNPTTLMLAGHVISHIQYHTVAIMKTHTISPPPFLGNWLAIVTQLPPGLSQGFETSELGRGRELGQQILDVVLEIPWARHGQNVRVASF